MVDSFWGVSLLLRKSSLLLGAELIRNIRLECAAEMLRTSQQTATEIAYQTGFGSYNHFGDYFKSVYGVSPKVYKEKYKNT